MGVSHELLVQELQEPSTKAETLLDHVRTAEKLTTKDLNLFIDNHSDKPEVLQAFLSTPNGAIVEESRPNLRETDSNGFTPFHKAVEKMNPVYLPVIATACQQIGYVDYWTSKNNKQDTALHTFLATKHDTTIYDFISADLERLCMALELRTAVDKMHRPIDVICELNERGMTNVYFEAKTPEGNNILQVCLLSGKFTSFIKLLQLPTKRLAPLLKNKNADNKNVTEMMLDIRETSIARIQELETNLGTKSDDNDILQRELSAANEELAKLRPLEVQLASAIAELDELRPLKSQLKQAEAELTTLRPLAAALETANNELTTLRPLTKQLESANNELEKLRELPERLEEALREIDVLTPVKATCEELARELSDARTRLDENAAIIESNRSMISGLNEASRLKDENINRLQVELRRVQVQAQASSSKSAESTTTPTSTVTAANKEEAADGIGRIFRMHPGFLFSGGAISAIAMVYFIKPVREMIAAPSP